MRLDQCWKRLSNLKIIIRNISLTSIRMRESHSQQFQTARPRLLLLLQFNNLVLLGIKLISTDYLIGLPPTLLSQFTDRPCTYYNPSGWIRMRVGSIILVLKQPVPCIVKVTTLGWFTSYVTMLSLPLPNPRLEDTCFRFGFHTQIRSQPRLLKKPHKIMEEKSK